MIASFDLERDMQNSKMVLAKVQSDRYAQNLYAAMCNMQWQKREVLPVLKDELWSCTWRSSGGIVARLRSEGDYMNWYCSGIMDPEDQLKLGYVSEGVVADEIKADLATLGWYPVPWADDI